MVKVQLLRQKLIKLGIIMSVAVCVSLAVAYGVYSWSSGLQQQARASENNLFSARNDVEMRKTKNEEALKYQELYRSITGADEQAKISDLNREKAQQWLLAAAVDNGISGLEGSFDPVTPINDPAFKKNTLEGIHSLVKLKFAAMTDVQIYHFIDKIQKDFPGYVKVNRFVLERKGDVTDAVFINAGRGDFPALVEGQMEFRWIGVREVQQDEQGQQAQQPQSTAPQQVEVW